MVSNVQINRPMTVASTAGRLRAFSRLLILVIAVLFVAAPIADAAACGFETEASHALAADSDSDRGKDDGARDHGVCAHGHCHHIAGEPAKSSVELLMSSTVVCVMPADDHLIAYNGDGLKRPPKA